METNFVQHAVNLAYKQAINLYGKEQVIGAFVYGSQNYGLADEKSDVDVKVLLLPSATDIYMNAKPVSKEGEFQLPAAGDAGEWRPVCPAEEAFGSTYGKIVYRDVRLWLENVLKGNLNAFELLFSSAYTINEIYLQYMEKILENRDKVAFINPDGTAKVCYCMAKSAYAKAIFNGEIVDCKALVNLYRLFWFLNVYQSAKQPNVELAFIAASNIKNTTMRRKNPVEVCKSRLEVLTAAQMVDDMQTLVFLSKFKREYSKTNEHLFTSQIWEMINKGYLMTIPVKFSASEDANITTSKIIF